VKKYTVTFEIDSGIAEQINRLSQVPVEVLAKRYLEKWLEDGRHTMFEAKRITIAWPTDWWAAMCKLWGQRAISPNLRKLIYEKLNSPRNPLPAPPEIRDDEPNKTGRTVAPSSEDRNTIITALIVPQAYYDRLVVEYGDGQVSRAIKAFAYYHMMSLKVKGLSEPFRMGKFLEQHSIEELFRN
jgi:hypothetical protein